VICYYCQERNHYANDYIKSINNLNNICISAVSQSKKKHSVEISTLTEQRTKVKSKLNILIKAIIAVKTN